MSTSNQAKDIEPPKYLAIADRVASHLDADVLFFNGPLQRHHDQTVIDLCRRRCRRKNVFMLLITDGGNADAAYRIARCLQRYYDRFILFVPGYCKSAGTLVALGANELVVADGGELGPLDVQMSKKDELALAEQEARKSEVLKQTDKPNISKKTASVLFIHPRADSV